MLTTLRLLDPIDLQIVTALVLPALDRAGVSDSDREASTIARIIVGATNLRVREGQDPDPIYALSLATVARGYLTAPGYRIAAANIGPALLLAGETATAAAYTPAPA